MIDSPKRKKVRRGVIRFPSSINIDENDFYALQNIFPRERLPNLVDKRGRDMAAPLGRKSLLPVVEIGDEKHGYRVRKLRLSSETIIAMGNDDDCQLMTSIIELDALDTLHLETFYFDNVAIGSWIEKLSNLKELVLCSPRNDWIDDAPGAIGRLGHLEKLVLHNTEFPHTLGTEGFPTEIYNLTNLKELEISHADVLPDGIQRLTNLEILRLPHSTMATLPEAVRGLAKLRCLDLSYSSSYMREHLPEGLMETILQNQTHHVWKTLGSRLLTEDVSASLWPLVITTSERSCLRFQKFDDGCIVPSPEDLTLFLVRKGVHRMFSKPFAGS